MSRNGAEQRANRAIPGVADVPAPAVTADFIARYDSRVPRYTSYPTAPHFKPEVGAETYAEWLRDLAPEARLSLYLHIPFCAELCFYCGCHTTVARRYSPVASYVKLLEREIGLVAERLQGRRPVVHIHWGGGTPTILTPDDLVGLGRALRSRFDIGAATEVAVEIDPRTLTIEHVDALAAIGLTRASLGVQDFDPQVQHAVNRIQSYEETERAAHWLRRAGATSLNLDLMYGLPHQTVDGVVRSVTLALALDPDRIALFGYAHVPWMKRHQALLPADALPDAGQRLAQMHAAAAVITDAGYVPVGLDHFAKSSDPLAQSQSQGELHRNFQGYTTDCTSALIGLGTSAIGTLPQGYVQNAPGTVAYRAAIAAGRLATVRGLRLTADDRLRGAVIERLMCDLAVDLDRVAAEHGVPAATFAPELQRLGELAADGLVVCAGNRITVPEAARPFIRTVCAVFDVHLSQPGMRHSAAL